MAYAVLADMLARNYSERELIQRTNQGVDNPTAVNEAILGQALADASEEMNSYLGAFSLPFAEPYPPRLVAICCTLAYAELFKDASFEPDRPPDWLRRRKEAIKMLEGIRDGVIELGLPTQAPRAAVVRVSGNRRVFSRSTLRDM